MPDGTGANRREIHRAIEALTPGELLKLKHFAVFRIRGLGRAASGRTCEDLLSEARLAFLEGAASNGTGRNLKAGMALVTQLIGAMRSISSHWKRDFDEQEPDLESEILTPTEEGQVTSPLANVASHTPSHERELAARQQWNLITTRCKGSRAASHVLEGLSQGLTASRIMRDYHLSKWQYQEAMKRIRLHARDMGQ
jgi:hypothetical protein